jgi:hypothetical protein
VGAAETDGGGGVKGRREGEEEGGRREGEVSEINRAK